MIVRRVPECPDYVGFELSRVVWGVCPKICRSYVRDMYKQELGTNRVRVSVSCPLIGSSTVRNKTPFCRPMLTNMVGWVLLMLASNISAIQMADGGAVNA